MLSYRSKKNMISKEKGEKKWSSVLARSELTQGVTALHRPTDTSLQDESPWGISKNVSHIARFFIPCLDLSGKGCPYRHF